MMIKQSGNNKINKKSFIINTKYIFLIIILVLLITPLQFSPSSNSGGQSSLNTPAGQITNYISNINQQNTKGIIINTDTCGTVQNSEWVDIFGIGLILILIGILIYYIVGKTLSSTVITNTAKNELYSLFDALLIIGIFFILYGPISQVAFNSMSYLNKDPIYGTSANKQSLIQSTINICNEFTKKIAEQYGILVVYNSRINAIYSATLWFGTTWMSTWQFNLGPALRPAIDAISMAMTFMSLGLTEWILKGALLCFINKWATFIGILGIVLTVFPFSRKFGYALLSLMIAFMTIYPIMLITNYEAYKVIIVNPKLDQLDLLKFSTPEMNMLLFTAGFLILGSLSAPIWYFFTVSIITTAISLSLLYVFLFSFFLPFLNITITLTFANEFARFFGVVTNFMSFMRLI